MTLPLFDGMRLFRAAVVAKRKFPQVPASVCSNRTNPALPSSIKVFSIARGRARCCAEKRLPPVTRILYKRRTLRNLSMSSRGRCAPHRRSLFATRYLPAAGFAPTTGWSRMRPKMHVITNTYERRADGIKCCLGPSAPCFSPVINREDGIRMLQVRRAGKASGQAPRTSEKAVGHRDLTARERAFSLRRRGGSLTSHRPHASSRGYLAVRPLRVRLITKNQYAIQNETRIVRV
jgi:hypothetical protein